MVTCPLLTHVFLTAHALPMFREHGGGATMKKVKDKQRADPVKSKKPETPLTGAGMLKREAFLFVVRYYSLTEKRFTLSKPDISDFKPGRERGSLFIFVPNFSFLGKGGRVASGISLSQFVSKNLAVKNLDDSNPRESILRHAKVCPLSPNYNNHCLSFLPFFSIHSTHVTFICSYSTIQYYFNFRQLLRIHFG